MPYASNADLPEAVRNALPAEGQSTFRTIVNSALEQYNDEGKAMATAWAGLRNAGWKKVDGEWQKVEKTMTSVAITKQDEQGRVFGWASVAFKANGEQVKDLQDDVIDEPELEETAYKFVAEYMEAGVMHKQTGIGVIIESMVFTAEKQKALGISEGVVPVGWWLGMQVTDPEVKKAVRERRLTAFSIGGVTQREEVK